MNEINNENSNHLKYHGKIGKIYAIWIVNIILTICTLFIYKPWAKTRMRKYIYSSFSIDGERLEYTGIGKELFSSIIKVGLLMFLVSFIMTFGLIIFLMYQGNPQEYIDKILENASTALYFSFVYLIVFYAQFSALRYRLAKTTWRGIRGKLSGKPIKYMFYRIKLFILNIVSFGILIGRNDLLARKYIVERLSIGSEKFKFKDNINALNKVNIITLLLAIPTFGLSRFWYRASQLRTQWNFMSVGDIKFKATHTGFSLFLLTIINLLLIFCTLGLGIPFAIHNIARYFDKHVQIVGNLEGSSILQTENDPDATGEGVDEILDPGLDLDIGLF